MGATISLCMIVKDEEDFLEECLQGVKQFVDEIIVVDTGSTDSTKEIAKKFTDKVFDFPWTNDFSAARNESLKHATKDWILVLDADEKITKQDFARIMQLIKTDDFPAYSLIQRNYTNDSGLKDWQASDAGNSFSGFSPAIVTRLFKRGFTYSGKVHENILDSMQGKKVKSTTIAIHHFANQRSEDRLKKKGEIYKQLGKEKVLENKDLRSKYELAKQEQQLGNTDKAILLYKECIKLNNGFMEAYESLGSLYIIKKMPDDAAYVLTKALNIGKKNNIENPETMNNLGIVYAKQNKLSASVLLFKKAIELKPDFASAYFNLGISLDKIKRFDEAKENFRKAIKLNPKYRDVINIEE